jgi:CubicO group peptidase (beta-lactamase class C family)
VLQLVGAGVLDLDEAVDTYLRKWRPPVLDPRRPITLRTLLTHTSGLNADEFDGPGARGRDEIAPSIDDMLAGRPPARTAPVHAEAPPSGRFGYSGNNYIVIEQVIREVTRKPFEQIVQELVFEPLNLHDSGYGSDFLDSRATPPAIGHTSDGAPLSGGWCTYPAAAGGLWTTAGDLARIAAEIRRANDGGTAFLDQQSAQEILAPVGPQCYGLGTIIRTSNGIRWFGHSGETAGYRAHSMLGLETGTGLVVMANGEGGSQFVVDLLVDLGLGMRVWLDRGSTHKR